MAREPNYYVYMLASRRGGTLYVGVTSDIAFRVSQHRESVGSTFTARYGVKRLVWYEHHSEITSAIAREKRIKKWPRKWKVQLIEASNILRRLLSSSAQAGDPVNTGNAAFSLPPSVPCSPHAAKRNAGRGQCTDAVPDYACYACSAPSYPHLL